VSCSHFTDSRPPPPFEIFYTRLFKYLFRTLCEWILSHHIRIFNVVYDSYDLVHNDISTQQLRPQAAFWGQLTGMKPLNLRPKVAAHQVSTFCRTNSPDTWSLKIFKAQDWLSIEVKRLMNTDSGSWEIFWEPLRIRSSSNLAIFLESRWFMPQTMGWNFPIISRNSSISERRALRDNAFWRALQLAVKYETWLRQQISQPPFKFNQKLSLSFKNRF